MLIFILASVEFKRVKFVSKIHRNEPCPCGSGKKYKKCCMNQAAAANEAFSEHVAGQSFDSLADLEAQASSFFQQRNEQPIDDFMGLSADQMDKILSVGFESPELLHFAASPSAGLEAPVLLLANEIIQAIDDNGLKLTARGNLPRVLCQHAAEVFKAQYRYDDRLAITSVNKEDDFFELHVTHILLKEAGLIRSVKGRLVLSAKCKKLIGVEKQVEALYGILFQGYCQKFNWSYRDGYPELGFVQQSALFTVYLLSILGDEWQSVDVYAQRYLQAFPMVLDEMTAEDYASPAVQFGHFYHFRILQGFLQYMGLAEVESGDPVRGVRREYKIRALPLLHKFLQWPHLTVERH